MIASNIISAFSEDHIERLTSLTKRQLRHWDKTGLFVPSLAAENRKETFSRVYSFKDVAALRVLASLRDQVSLQHLRQVSHRLSHLGDDRWTKTTLYVVKKKVIFSDPESGTPREVVSGQYVFTLPLAQVLLDTKNVIEQLNQRTPGQIGAVAKNRLVVRNASVVAGTRIPTGAIKRFHAAGYSVEAIIQEYPDLTEKDVLAALAYEEGAAA